MIKSFVTLLGCTIIFLTSLSGQQEAADSLILGRLETVTVTSSRLESEESKTPIAITIVESSRLQTGQQQLSINESLGYVPGVFALNPDNFAQDLRVSIRGFGARAAFGIRGIKLLVDGIPESTPDGQAQVDNLDLAVLDRMEVIRGPASGLYGNASGGVISFTTEDPPESLLLEGKTTFGAFGYQLYQLKAGEQLEKFGFLVHGAYTSLDGYRENSGMENRLFNGKFTFRPNEVSRFRLLLNFADSPQADDPGGLTAEQVMEDRRQAFSRNLTFEGGEELQQGRVGLVYEGDFSEKHQLQARIYHVFRDFANRLPFENGGVVELDRSFSGGGLNYLFSTTKGNLEYRLNAGIDLERQTDDRLRFNNLEGEKGAQSFEQEESFRSLGTFLIQEMRLAEDLQFNLGLRLDAVRLKAEDRFLENGDESGEITLNSFNPLFGISYAILDGLNLYGNFATSFETPALSELSSDPSGEEGFNDSLEPQRATNYEIGLKGVLPARLRYNLALFYIEVEDELVPFELEAFPGRTFFRNAGQSERKGVEIGLQALISSGLTAYLTYTYSDFRYTSFEIGGTDFDGNRLPGIPEHTSLAELRYFSPFGLYAILQSRFVGTLYADDANTTEDDAYTLVNLRLGYQKGFPKMEIEPFLGINNLFDASYNSNIRINAFGGRYFEPAPGINLYAGLRIRFTKN